MIIYGHVLIAYLNSYFSKLVITEHLGFRYFLIFKKILLFDSIIFLKAFM